MSIDNRHYYAPDFLITSGTTELRHGATIEVISLAITETYDKADSFTFTISDRHPERARFAGGPQLQWLDSPVFNEGKEVTIEMGYVDNRAIKLAGEITAVSPTFPESGVPTLTVRGFSFLQRLQSKHRAKPFESATDSGIAQEIAREMGLTPIVDATTARHGLLAPNDASYHEILFKRAKRIGYEVTVKGQTLYFQKPRYLEQPTPAMTLEWGRDLINFTPTLNTNNMVTEVTVRGSQTSQGGAKTPLVGKAIAGNERVKMGNQTGPEIAKASKREKKVLLDEHDVADQQEANAIALAHLESAALEFVSGRGATIGNPALQARRLITLKGVGQRFSGNYYVVATTHTISASGYRTDFEVKRNGR
jgi:phage protein D